MHKKISRGFNINLAGKASKTTSTGAVATTYAIKPTDFVGMYRPKVLVKEGDSVKAGTPLFFDKKMPEVMYTSPVSGEIVEIKRGAKRKVLEVRILADKEMEYEAFPSFTYSQLQN
jgi:Na+-transporting NADH:ubiquinone oxidoreductase subunit A